MANIILSIDLDILFSPYVGIYNNQINNIYNCEAIWNNISNLYNITEFQPNFQYCELIINLLSLYSQKVEKIYIGQDHSSLLTVLNSQKQQFQIPYNFIIHNIDYHHDIGYGQDKKLLNEIKSRRSNCSNWIGFLNYYNFIKEYNWWHGIGSDFNNQILNNELKEIMPINFNQKLFNKNFPNNLDIDILYISLSLPWIPPYYYVIISEILKILDKQKIIYLENSFEQGNLCKPFLSLPGEKGYEEFKFLY